MTEDEWVEQYVAAAPPLSADQFSRLRQILSSVQHEAPPPQ